MRFLSITILVGIALMLAGCYRESREVLIEKTIIITTEQNTGTLIGY